MKKRISLDERVHLGLTYILKQYPNKNLKPESITLNKIVDSEDSTEYYISITVKGDSENLRYNIDEDSTNFGTFKEPMLSEVFMTPNIPFSIWPLANSLDTVVDVFNNQDIPYYVKNDSQLRISCTMGPAQSYCDIFMSVDNYLLNTRTLQTKIVK